MTLYFYGHWPRRPLACPRPWPRRPICCFRVHFWKTANGANSHVKFNCRCSLMFVPLKVLNKILSIPNCFEEPYKEPLSSQSAGPREKTRNGETTLWFIFKTTRATFVLQLSHKLISFQNYFTVIFLKDKQKFPPHPKRVPTLPCEIWVLKVTSEFSL